ncbi:MAG: CpsD/CapB family tyrosine-protein kinase [Caldilineaceae bacterium]|jgi:capsular exopolysaccharide synthesis family protein
MQNLITLTDPRSAAAEAYQSLRTNLEFSSLEQPLGSILVTGVDDTTEKSIALANLAVVMAQAGDRVTIVDGDLRRPQQHEIFDLPNHAGLATWLADEGVAPVQRTSIDGLQVLTSGPLPANPVALLSSRRLVEALEEIRAQTDYVLVDAPPILAVTDAALWASKLDGAVLLVNAGRTKREHAQRAKAVLEKVHARIVGSVLLNAEHDAVMTGYAS